MKACSLDVKCPQRLVNIWPQVDGADSEGLEPTGHGGLLSEVYSWGEL